MSKTNPLVLFIFSSTTWTKWLVFPKEKQFLSIAILSLLYHWHDDEKCSVSAVEGVKIFDSKILNIVKDRKKENSVKRNEMRKNVLDLLRIEIGASRCLGSYHCSDSRLIFLVGWSRCTKSKFHFKKKLLSTFCFIDTQMTFFSVDFFFFLSFFIDFLLN